MSRKKAQNLYPGEKIQYDGKFRKIKMILKASNISEIEITLDNGELIFVPYDHYVEIQS